MQTTSSENIPIVKNRRAELTAALVVVLILCGCVYLMARAVFIVFADYHRVEKVLAILFFCAEAFVLMHGFAFFISILKMNRKSLEEPEPGKMDQEPALAILVPARHEPKEVLDKTFTCLYNLNYKNKTIYLLDDSSAEEHKKEAEAIAEKYGAKVFRRTERHGAKAGIINDCVKSLDEKYVAVFDADQNPIPMFFDKLVPILEEDPKLAFVQTPQFYSNLDSSPVAFAANLQQSVFYEFVCEAKSSADAMMCCGTNVVFRREALEDVGGLDESTVTEDFATSFTFHRKGWKTLYYNHVYTFGQGPENIAAYFKQQNRWAAGNVAVLRKLLGRMLIHPRDVGFSQWMEYLTTGSYYLVGLAYMFLMLCPIIFLFTGIPSFFMHPAVYLLTFLPFMFLSYMVFYSTMGRRGYRARDLIKGQLLLYLSLPIYSKAALSGLLGFKSEFQVTSKGDSRYTSFTELTSQLLFWTICLSALTWGVNRLIYEPTPAVGINILWVCFHFLVLSSIFYFNDPGNKTASDNPVPEGAGQ